MLTELEQELLTALEAIVPDLVCTIREVIDNGGSGIWVAEAHGRLAAARAAIDKAKGKATGCAHAFERDAEMINVCTKCGVEGEQD